MENALTRTKNQPADSLAAATRQAREFISQARAPNTVRAYGSDCRHFEAWCSEYELAALPASPRTLAIYLAALSARAKLSTLERRVSAISQAHRMAGQPSPTGDSKIRALMRGIRRSRGSAQQGKKPLLTTDIRSMIAALPAGLLGFRDRALLLAGFAGAFRRSELVGLDAEELDFTGEGLVVTLRRSKTDQQGEGRKVGVPYGSNPETCPVRSIKRWLEVSGIERGPLFRAVNRHGQLQPQRLTPQSVALVVKRCVERLGKDRSAYAGHSLRSGHATQAAAGGASERAIINQTGHRSLKMVRRYIREGSLFRENGATRLGL